MTQTLLTGMALALWTAVGIFKIVRYWITARRENERFHVWMIKRRIKGL